MAVTPSVDDLVRQGAGRYAYRGGGPGHGGGGGAAATYLPQIRTAAGRYGLDPTLLAGVVDYESSGNPGAVNRSSGATGLGQVMPREAGFSGRPSRQELLDPDTNLDWSARILSEGIRRYGTENQGLAAYLGAIDPSGRITGATDANGTTGNAYIANVRQRQRQYRDAGPGAGGPGGADVDASGAPPWVRDLLSAGYDGGSVQPLPNEPRGAPGRGAEALPNPPPGAPSWVLDLMKSPGYTGGSPAAAPGGAGSRPNGAGYGGPPQTDEVWPVAGHKWGQVNNPFGGPQARSAGATVALPSSNVGADLTAQYGEAVVAPVSGTIEQVYDAQAEHNPNENSGWGGMTVLRGDNGYTYRLSHAAPGSVATRPGQRVAQGQQLQRVGISGNSTGPHVDAEKFDRPGHFVDIAAGSGGTAARPTGSAGAPAADSGPVPAWVRDLLGRGT
jgi:murein DD-endopeptidase MepM/ murein hydrolase activator NlpD